MDSIGARQGWIAAATALLMAGCSGGGDGGSPNGASLSVSLADAPVDDVAEVHVKIDAIWIKPSDGEAYELPLASGPQTLDLLAHSQDHAALLIDGASIAAGSYDWLAMDVSATFDGVYDSYVMTQTGGQVELRVPSGRVRLVDGFDVAANQAVKLMFDWDLRKGLVGPPGQPGYMLKPAFRVIDVSEYGVLRGTVALGTLTATGDPNGCLADDANVDIGNVVYIFAGSDVAPDDVDGVDPDPIATAAVSQDANGDYTYRTLLAPGEYTVAFTCQAANDDPSTDETGGPKELQFVGTTNETVTGDLETVADF